MSVRVSVYVALGLNRFNCERASNQPGGPSVHATRRGGREGALCVGLPGLGTGKRVHHEERTYLFHGLQGQSTFLQPETAFSLHQALAFDGRRTCAQARHYFDGNA